MYICANCGKDITDSRQIYSGIRTWASGRRGVICQDCNNTVGWGKNNILKDGEEFVVTIPKKNDVCGTLSVTIEKKKE